MGRVGVASCAHWAWLASSQTMGKHLAYFVEEGTECRVHAPIDKNGLIACMSESNYFIIHTHGSAVGFYDQREDGKSTTIATLSNVKNFPEFPNLRLVVITACETGKEHEGGNIACALSTKIDKTGLVFANRYIVFGSDYDFGERNCKHGWVAYQNGKIVLTEEELPARITMGECYQILVKYRKGLLGKR